MPPKPPPSKSRKICDDFQECHLSPDAPIAQPTRAPTYDDVNAYFSPSSECNVTVIAIDSQNDTILKDNVKYTLRDNNCVTFFTRSGPHYYYVYNRLMTSLFVWSDYHSMDGKMGSRISIGLRKNTSQNTFTFDVHETFYIPKKGTSDGLYRIAGKQYRFYTYDTKSHHMFLAPKQEKVRNTRKHETHYGAIIWNEILRNIDEEFEVTTPTAKTAHGGAPKKKQTNHTIATTNISQIFDIIDLRIRNAPPFDPESQTVFSKIPYISRRREKSASMRLQDLIKQHDMDIRFFTNHFIDGYLMGLIGGRTCFKSQPHRGL